MLRVQTQLRKNTLIIIKQVDNKVNKKINFYSEGKNKDNFKCGFSYVWTKCVFINNAHLLTQHTQRTTS